METMGSLKVSVTDWVTESVPDNRLLEAINDSIAHLWHNVLLANLSQFSGGPTNITLASGTERADIISVANPTVAPTPATLVDAASPFVAFSNYYGRYTWVTDSGSETLGSTAYGTCTLVAGGLRPGFSIYGILPPTYDGMIGWNLYISVTNPAAPGGTPAWVKANDMPIPFAQFTFYLPDELATASYPAGVDTRPLIPVVNNTADDVMYIRKMQVQTPDGTYKSWSGADLESELFQWAERTIASNSEYQSYVYDFLNNRTIEVRPALGSALTPRYFFVRKPRRIKYDSAVIPFNSIEGEAFLRYRSIGLILLSLHEYDASKQWMMLAEQEKQTVMLAVNIQNQGRVNTITPHMR